MKRHRLIRIGLQMALALGTLAAQAAPDPSGRWQGVAAIPGAPQVLVVDIARDAVRGWQGSVILPGRGVKGAPLAGLVVDEQGLRFDLAAAFNDSADESPGVDLRWLSDGNLAGVLRQGGLSAPLLLRRSGPAQVDLPQTGTALSAALRGTWRGRYELGGYPREVTLVLANRPDGLGGGELLIVGKRTSRLTIDRVVQGSEFVTLESTAAGVRIEGRWRMPEGSFHGHFVQGPFEAAVELRKSAEGSAP